MKKSQQFALLFMWLVFATLLLAHFWLTYPNAGPHVPPSLAEWLINVYHSRNGEDLADLEDLFALAVSFLIVAALTTAAYLGWRRYFKGSTVSAGTDK